MQKQTQHRILGRLALALAVAALGPLAGQALGASGAADWPDARNLAPIDSPASGVTSWPDARNLAPLASPTGSGAVGWPDARNLAPVDPPVQIVVRPGRFDWTDAGIGFGAAFGLVLLASGASLVARRHRRSSLATL